MVKRGYKIFAIRDSPFKKKQKKVFVVGVTWRLSQIVEGFSRGVIEKDGYDSTDVIAGLAKPKTSGSQLKCIMLWGCTIGGLNIIDLNRLYGITNIPVISVLDRNPRIHLVKQILNQLGQRSKISVLESNGPYSQFKVGRWRLYLNFKGIKERECLELVNSSLITGKIPEPLRLAHIAARLLYDLLPEPGFQNRLVRS